MTTIITADDGTAIYPTIVDGFESSRESQNLVRTILGREAPSVALRPATLRRGTLTLVFGTEDGESELVVIDGIVQSLTTPSQDGESASAQAEALHAAGRKFTISDTDRASIAMTYVVQQGGRISRSLDPETREVWLLTIDFQEVPQ